MDAGLDLSNCLNVSLHTVATGVAAIMLLRLRQSFEAGPKLSTVALAVGRWSLACTLKETPLLGSAGCSQ